MDILILPTRSAEAPDFDADTGLLARRKSARADAESAPKSYDQTDRGREETFDHHVNKDAGKARRDENSAGKVEDNNATSDEGATKTDNKSDKHTVKSAESQDERHQASKGAKDSDAFAAIEHVTG
ncbi:MAG: hypothetical protein ACX939_07780, partial [Hyphococcus sp.]